VAEPITDRPRHYVLDSSDEDLQRLLSISELMADAAADDFRRVGARDGWSAIDCGCGPIGALTVMADIVGPTGRVVGVDLSEAAVQRARSIVKMFRLDNVEPVVGDIYALGPTTIGCGFDLAFTRCFLMHQADPVRALSQISTILRPGGWIVSHEPLPSPPPRSYPQLGALATYWEVLHDVMGIAGARPGAVEGLAQSAREAGLEVVDVRGFFVTMAPDLGFDLHRATIAAARERAVTCGIPAGTIDGLQHELDAAKNGDYEWVSSPFFLGLTLRKPPA
jgi:SAM-dependent methyltransferase